MSTGLTPREKRFAGVLLAGGLFAASASAVLADREPLPPSHQPAVSTGAPASGEQPQASGQASLVLGQSTQPLPSQAQPINDPALEARALALGHQLRCVVCQNQSIAESNAELARDLMNEVRAMLRAGQSDREIIDFLVARYGEFVLFKPPFDLRTLLLWIGPFVLAVAAVWALWVAVQKRNRQQTIPQLDEAAKAHADALLGDPPMRKEPP